MPAEADGALHVALERDTRSTPAVEAALAQRRRGEAHHDLGAAQERARSAPASKVSRASGSVTTPTRPRPVGRGRVHGQRGRRGVRPRAPVASFAVEQQLVGGASAGRSAIVPAEAIAMREHVERAGRSGARPMPPATMTQVAAAGLLQRPGRAVRTTHSDGVAGRRRAQSASHRARPRGWCASASRSPAVVSPLTEIGTSPAPNAYSMANWPGPKGGMRGPPAGTSRSVASVGGLRRAVGDPERRRVQRLAGGPGLRRSGGLTAHAGSRRGRGAAHRVFWSRDSTATRTPSISG